MKKICSKCKNEKEIEEFAIMCSKELKRRARCKQCVNEYNKSYKEKNLESIRDKWRVASRKYDRSDKTRRRNKTLEKYGLNIDTYNKMFDEQGGKCKICDRGISLVVDHCHNTGKIRGLLCNDCNVGLGTFKDNKELLLKAIGYLNI